MEDEFKNYSLLNSINDIKSRRALTLVFNDGQSAFIYASVLIYLTIEYLNQKKTNQSNLDKYDGYMVKTPFDAEVELGIHAAQIRTIYTGLEAKGLIQIKKQGQDNRTCIKVNLDEVNRILNEYLVKYDDLKNQYVEEKNKKREARKAKVNKGDEIEVINQLSVDNNFEELSDYIKDHNKLSLVYGVNHYYRKITNKTFIWSLGDLNTMLQPWRNRWSYKGAELGLALAVKKAVEDTSKLYFGLKFKQYFNIQLIPTDEVEFDNIFQIY